MDLNLINVITLAYIGDAIYELYVREYLIKRGIAKVEELQKESVKYVSAKSQCKILSYLIDNNLLTEIELDVVKRGRNYKRTSHPKNTGIITYKMSSGFEAMIGYLYLDNNKDRLNEIMNYILGGIYEKENN
jgi:ribonuclease-3 family protein